VDNLHIPDVGKEFGKLFRKVQVPDRLHGPRRLFGHLQKLSARKPAISIAGGIAGAPSRHVARHALQGWHQG